MESVTSKPPLIVILGQTGSGKSSLAMHLAQRFRGEIIAADSRTIYKGMDIGTAKPSLEDRELIPHHLLDVVAPDKPFTVADFQTMAQDAIADIRSREMIPFLVGGSGLYIDAVIYNFTFRRPANPEVHGILQKLTVQELQAELERRGLPLPVNSSNPRHLIRSIETAGEISKRSSLAPNTLVIGLAKEPEQLKIDVTRRVDQMIENGLAEEVRFLADTYGWNATPLQTPEYKPFQLFFANQISLEEVKRRIVQNDLQYAKRQKTWFRRNKDIHWISKSEEAVDLITTQLNN